MFTIFYSVIDCFEGKKWKHKQISVVYPIPDFDLKKFFSSTFLGWFTENSEKK